MPSRLTAFQGCVWVALVAVTIVVPGRSAHAQSLEPRSYVNTPVGINFLLLGYGYTQGQVGFDASTPITDARVHVHAGFLAYSRSLDLWGLSGKVLGVLPVADASGSAKLNGQEVERDVLGLGDPLLRLSVNFFGAQLGVSKAWGPVTLEVIPAITFFTNNDDFLRGKTLEQDPIYSVQGHLIYEISPALWTAFDATYYTGGRTTIDGEKGERLENVRLGLTTSLSLSRHQSIKLFGSAGVYHRIENNFWAVGLAWQFRWGGGL